ncbi:MAG TPA: hypothetical protein VEA18_01215 [Candidatus Kapabacteria bacterium]|nr:hypothetical protein [Candidatus Kapabacteria bacterium]
MNQHEQLPPTVESPSGGSQTLQELVEKNIKWSQVVYEQNRKILRRMTLMTIASYVRLFLILIPLLIALIYLPPLISGYVEQMNALLGSGENGGRMNLQDILSQFSGQ